MSVQDKFQLYVYDGDYGVPSFSAECTQSILYATIAKLPVQLKLLDNVKHCVMYSAPTLVHKNIVLKGFDEIVPYLKTLNYNLDADLTSKQSSETLAFVNYVRSKLRPVIEYVCWIDKRNSDEFTSKWFMRALPVPFNYILTKTFRENANDLMETLYPQENSSFECVKEYLNVVCTECLSSMSTRLGTNDFFYGSSPTLLDVIVYSYVAPLMKFPFPSNDLSNLVSMWPNLQSFVKRIDAKYFPEVRSTTKYLKDEEKPKNNEDEVSYVAICILTVSALSLVLGFAFTKGIFAPRGYN